MCFVMYGYTFASTQADAITNSCAEYVKTSYSFIQQIARRLIWILDVGTTTVVVKGRQEG